MRGISKHKPNGHRAHSLWALVTNAPPHLVGFRPAHLGDVSLFKMTDLSNTQEKSVYMFLREGGEEKKRIRTPARAPKADQAVRNLSLRRPWSKQLNLGRSERVLLNSFGLYFPSQSLLEDSPFS